MKRITNDQSAGRGKRLAARARILALRLEALCRNRYAKKRLALRAKAILLRLGALSCGLYGFLAACALAPSLCGDLPAPWHLYLFAALGGAAGFGALLHRANGVDAQVYRLMEAEWRDAALSGMMPRDWRHVG